MCTNFHSYSHTSHFPQAEFEALINVIWPQQVEFRLLVAIIMFITEEGTR